VTVVTAAPVTGVTGRRVLDDTWLPVTAVTERGGDC
jgi:hypothetical protein